MATILNRLGEDLQRLATAQGAQPVSLDPAFCLTGQFAGQSVHLEPFAARGAGLDWARVARLKGGKRVQVVNAVFLPTLERGGPIFAAELLVFGAAVHLFVADMVGSQGPAREQLREVKTSLSQDFELQDPPSWGGRAFSEDLIFLKPGKKAQLSPADLEEPIQLLARAWAEEFAGPWQSPDYAALRHEFLRIQREHEPARPFLNRLAGEEAVTHLADHYLYPRRLSGLPQ